jgi:hypothetical protein
MLTVTEILLIAGVKFQIFSEWPQNNVYLTQANQIMATYKNLGQFRDVKTSYKSWHCHHIVEVDDLLRLGVRDIAPPRDDQLCVLLPERAHVGRINSILRRENPTKWQASGRELRRAYAEAYALIGDYCGGGERQIRQELMAIVEAEFQQLGVP